MFNKAIIHYPSDEKAVAQISKEIAAFRCLVIIKYIETLKMNDRQIDTLYAALAEDIAARRKEGVL